MDNDLEAQIEGTLEPELAELTLGQRIKGLTGHDPDSSASETENPSSTKRLIEVPPESLAHTLTQALHSSDTRLLESCLSHSDPALIRDSVRRIPPQLAVPLLTACVERLGRGKAGNSGRPRGAGASAERGHIMVAWIRTVLIVHSAHLMTVSPLLLLDLRHP